MKLNVYAMRDLKTSFMQPTVDQNDTAAIRAFDTAIRRTDDILHFHKEDFQLYKIGVFDSDSGLITALPMVELIAEGKDVNLDV